MSFLGFWSIAQENSGDYRMDRSIREWRSLEQNDTYSVDFRYADCDPSIGFNKEIIQLRFTNKSDQKIELKWHVYKYFNGVCTSCDYPEEYTYSIMLEPNKSVSGDCSLECDAALTIFSRFIDPGYKGNQQLTNFELHGLSVNAVK